MTPLGAGMYVAAINRAFNERWIHLMPTEGKRFRSIPHERQRVTTCTLYMLINYTVSTPTCRPWRMSWGMRWTALHSNRAQPFELAGYHTFVAEVASQFNEDLLLDYILKQVKDKDTRIAILGNYLETLKATVFRQTQFADFELRAHQMAEQGKPLTGDSLAEALSRRHQEVLRPRSGRLRRGRLHRARVELRFRTSTAATTCFSTRRRSRRPPRCRKASWRPGARGADATKRYLRFLSSGGSKYPIDLLKDAGVDMTDRRSRSS